MQRLRSRARDELEAKVQERTRELQRANAELQAEIAERKRAEEQLRESESRLRLLTELIPQQVWTSRPDGWIDYCNQRWLDYTGLTLKEAEGDGWMKVVHPDDVDEVPARWRDQLSAGTPQEAEMRLRAKDGSYRWFLVRVFPLRDADGRIVKWYGANTDIEDLKRAEEELRRSERRYRNLIETADEGVWTTDVDGRINYVNQRMCEITGYRPEEMLRRPAEEFLPAMEKEWVYRRLEDRREGWRGRGEIAIRHKNGSAVWVSCSSNPIFDDKDQLCGTLALVTDVSERKRAEEALRQARAELAHVTRMMTMGELAAAIAHEVNQPLAAVVANGNAGLRWLEGKTPNLVEAREAARRIIRDANRASEVITHIRALLRTSDTEKKADVEKAWLNVNRVIQEVIDLTRSEILRNRVSLRTELAALLPPVIGDRVQLQQVVLNLIMNAIEAMSPIQDRSRDLIIRTERNESSVVLVTVEDSGIGLDPQQMHRLFDAFFTTKPNGMGMGLPISRTIVEAHGGQLWALRNAGPGLTFQFTLPADTERES